MKLYNSLSKEKEEFKPIQLGEVSMYSCGPTVYDKVHIGNLRSFILSDFIRRSFEYLDYNVLQVMNITDIGHLVSDADDGEDKMSKGLRREGKEINIENMLALADGYAHLFMQDIAALNMLTPQHLPKASDHIQEDIDIIKQLEEKGFVYVISDGVYFDVSKMPDYGKLGGINLDGNAHSRIGENSEKRNPADFALWKLDTNLGWDSPWGQGFPGWHIECSGMSKKYLGDHFDIHTGGIDNRDIHHNNEIAQSECSSGKPFVNYWIHGEHLDLNNEKLSKSTGGNITLETLSEKGFSPFDFRYLSLQTHYRSKMNFTWEVLESARSGLEKVYKQIIGLRKQPNGTGAIDQEWKVKFIEKVSDDINLPQALAVFHDMMKSDLNPADKLLTALDFDCILGLNLSDQKESSIEIPKNVQTLLTERLQARLIKDWTESDRLRDEVAVLGYKVLDISGEQFIEKI